jgi:catechol 2,3-dioxygenase-like lactoylglutathione lyase family enzyme
MIAQELEVTLHMAFMDARAKRHEFISVEHLLLALLDNPSASKVLRACSPDVEQLRKLLSEHVTRHTPVVKGDEVDTQPTLGFQRVIQHAILNVQSAGALEVTGVNVLMAIFGEEDAHAVSFLHQIGVRRIDVVASMELGVNPSKPGERSEPRIARPLMLSTSRLIAFVATTDLARARKFYEDTLGLALVSVDSSGCELNANGTPLRIAAVPRITPANHTVVGWRVADIRGAMEVLQAKGVSFERYPGLEQDAVGIWVAPSGSQVCWFKDPDGNVLSLTQSG